MGHHRNMQTLLTLISRKVDHKAEHEKESLTRSDNQLSQNAGTRHGYLLVMSLVAGIHFAGCAANTDADTVADNGDGSVVESSAALSAGLTIGDIQDDLPLCEGSPADATVSKSGHHVAESLAALSAAMSSGEVQGECDGSPTNAATNKSTGSVPEAPAENKNDHFVVVCSVSACCLVVSGHSRFCCVGRECAWT